MEEQVKRGFACGSNAADAARKNHEFGTAHKFNSQTAAAAGRLGAEKRWGPADRRAAPRGPDRRVSS
jgi:hypothetical protein